MLVRKSRSQAYHRGHLSAVQVHCRRKVGQVETMTFSMINNKHGNTHLKNKPNDKKIYYEKNIIDQTDFKFKIQNLQIRHNRTVFPAFTHIGDGPF